MASGEAKARLHFKKLAKQVFALTDQQLQRLVENGQFEELVKDAEEIP